MHLNKSLYIFLGAAITTASAGCFSGGQPGRLEDLDGNKVLEQICVLYAGDFESQEDRHPCGTDVNGVKWDFVIKNTKAEKRNLAWSACLKYMQDRLKGCAAEDKYWGGDGTYDLWEIKVDPNGGTCLGVN